MMFLKPLLGNVVIGNQTAAEVILTNIPVFEWHIRVFPILVLGLAELDELF